MFCRIENEDSVANIRLVETYSQKQFDIHTYGSMADNQVVYTTELQRLLLLHV
jgi:hypothetical protein